MLDSDNTVTREDADRGTTGLKSLALTMREAAEECRICERSIWQAIKDGHLKAAKLGRSVRIRREELERFLRESEA